MVGERITGRPATLASLALAFLFVLTADSLADVYSHGFRRISSNSAVDVASQLSVDIAGYGSNQVVFTFQNSGAVASGAVIADIYFDDRAGLLLSLDRILDRDYSTEQYPGVDFSTPATPLNLPGGKSIAPVFQASDALSFDADNPGPKWGIGAAESLSLRFNVAADGLDAILSAIHSSDFRIGLHVQCLPAFAGDGSYNDTSASDGFVTTAPLPDAAILGTSGLSLAAYWLKRRRGGLAGI